MLTHLPITPCRKGLTVVEVVAAIALIAISIGGIVGVLVQNTSTGQTIDYTYVAANLAKNKIEELREFRRDKGFEALNELTSESTETIDRYERATSTGVFKRTTKIEPNATTELTKITVKVEYKRGGILMPVSIQLVTLLSEYHE